SGTAGTCLISDIAISGLFCRLCLFGYCHCFCIVAVLLIIVVCRLIIAGSCLTGFCERLRWRRCCVSILLITIGRCLAIGINF
ncbi:hypothetical protein, partial [Oenococcus oeni]|uniref:hypothetical protein n=1 Tax=Oenococcus oeni TaxID=1247 RepID=UPI001C5BA4F7